jgi:hypothetical protein
MNADAVFWGSVISVVICVVIIGFLAVKVGQLMKKDAERHNK